MKRNSFSGIQVFILPFLLIITVACLAESQVAALIPSSEPNPPSSNPGSNPSEMLTSPSPSVQEIVETAIIAPVPEIVETATITPIPDEPDVPLLKFIQAGSFLMGSLKDDKSARPDELPQHTIRLPGYWIYTYEVTNKMFAACVADGKCSAPATADTGPKSYYGNSKYNQFPVVGITWDQANQFCKANAAHLPSEAEWEKAARGFYGYLYPWGKDQPVCTKANYLDCVKDITKSGVNLEGQSQFEVIDMAGNVREWTNDWYQADYYKTSPLFMPSGPEKGDLKVVRGGGYLDTISDIRSAVRLAYDPLENFEDVGFRCVPDGLAQASMCLAEYRPGCQSGSDQPDGGCTPGNLDNKVGVDVSCSKNGTGTVTVHAPVGYSYDVTVDGNHVPCSSNGSKLVCDTALPAEGETISVKVCNVGPTAFNIPNLGNAMGCSTFSLLVPAVVTVLENNSSYFIGNFPSNVKIVAQCPTNYTWDPNKKSCVLDDKPIEIPTGSEQFCPTGYAYLSDLGCCVPATPGQCPEGQYATMGSLDCAFYQDNGCPNGYIPDPYKGCIQTPPGEDYSEWAYGCPAGTHYVDGSGCTKNHPQLVACPEGSQNDPNMPECHPDYVPDCPIGTYRDKDTKLCVPSQGANSGCPPTMVMNASLNCCVPQPGSDGSTCPEGSTDISDPEQGYDSASVLCASKPVFTCPDGYKLNGPYCVPKDCPQGTVPSSNFPGLCEPEPGKDCPKGTAPDPLTGSCALPATQTQATCGENQYYDSQLGFCIVLNSDCCAQGYYFNPDTKQCTAWDTSQQGQCPVGYIDQGGVCVEDPVMQAVLGCNTFTLTIPACQKYCPKGWSQREDGTCYCPKPKVIKNGQCVNKPTKNCGSHNSKDSCTVAGCTWTYNPSGSGYCH